MTNTGSNATIDPIVLTDQLPAGTTVVGRAQVSGGDQVAGVTDDDTASVTVAASPGQPGGPGVPGNAGGPAAGGDGGWLPNVGGPALWPLLMATLLLLAGTGALRVSRGRRGE